MFPLSDHFESVARLATYFAFCVVFSVLAFRRFRFAIVPILAFLSVAIYLIWCWNRDTAHDQYHGLGVLLGLGLFLTVTGFAAAWGGVIAIVHPALRRNKSKPPNIVFQCAIALVPSIILTGLTFERQIVVPSTCSEERVVINLGSAEFDIHPEMRAQLRRGTRSPKGGSQFYMWYSREPKRKEDLRAICDAAEGGQKAVPMDRISFHTSSAHERMQEVCSGASASTRPYCKSGLHAFLSERASVKILDRTTQRLPTQLSWMEKDDSSYLQTGGDGRNGFICQGEDFTGSGLRCYAWREIGPDTAVFVDTWSPAKGTKSEHLDRARKLLDWVPQAFMH